MRSYKTLDISVRNRRCLPVFVFPSQGMLANSILLPSHSRCPSRPFHPILGAVPQPTNRADSEIDRGQESVPLVCQSVRCA